MPCQGKTSPLSNLRLPAGSFPGLESTRQPGCTMLEPRQRVGASQTPCYAFHPTWVVWGDEIPLLSRGMPGMGGAC